MAFFRHHNLRTTARRNRINQCEELEQRALMAGMTDGGSTVGGTDQQGSSGVEIAPAQPLMLVAPMGITESVVSARLDPHIDEAFPNETLHQTYDPTAMPSIATAGFEDGAHVTIWTSFEAGKEGVYGQRVDAHGEAGPRFLVSPLGTQLALASVRAISLEHDNYLVAWTDFNGIHGLILNGSDQPASPIIDFGPGGSSSGYEFDVVRDHADGFYIVFNEIGSNQILGQHFGATGQPQNPEFILRDVGSQSSIAGLRSIAHRDADFVVQWTEVNFGASGTQHLHYLSESINGVPSPPIVVGDAHAAIAPNVAFNVVGDFVTVEKLEGATGSEIVLKFWQRSGVLQSTTTLASSSDYGSIVPPTVARLDGGGFVVHFIDFSGTETRLFAQQLSSVGNLIGSPMLVNANVGQEISFLETAAGSALAHSTAWISYDYASNEVSIHSRGYQPGVSPLVLDLLAEPPELANLDDEPIIRLTGLDRFNIPIATLEGDVWVVDHLEENVVPILHGTPPGPLQIGLEVFDPADPSEAIFAQYFVLSAEQPDRLHSTSADEQIDGGDGVDTVVLNGHKHEFTFDQTPLGVLVTRTGSAEEDLLRNVEQVRFDDIRLPLDSVLGGAPQTADDDYSTHEDVALAANSTEGLLANDHFGDALPRATVLFQDPTYGHIALGAAGEFDFVPPADFSGPSEFYYDTRLRFLDNAIPRTGGGLRGTVELGLPALILDSLPSTLIDGLNYRISFVLESVDAGIDDLSLQLDNGTALVPVGHAGSNISGLAGQQVTFEYTKAASDLGLMFSTSASVGSFDFDHFEIVEADTNDPVMSSNVYDYLNQLVTVSVAAVADTPFLAIQPTYDEEGATLLDVQAGSTDVDGSEQVSIFLNNLPLGMQVTDGTHQYVAATSNAAIDITGWNLDALQLTPRSDETAEQTVVITVVASEPSNGNAANVTGSVLIPPLPAQESGGEENKQLAVFTPPAPIAPANPPAPNPGLGGSADDAPSSSDSDEAPRPESRSKQQGDSKNAANAAPVLPASSNPTTDDGASDGLGGMPSPLQSAEQEQDKDAQQDQRAPVTLPPARQTPIRAPQTSRPDVVTPSLPTPSALHPPAVQPVVQAPTRSAQEFSVAPESTVAASFDCDQLWSAVDEVVIEVEKVVASQEMLAGSAVVVAIGFSTSQVVWLLRGSTLVSKLLSSAPMWFSFDPLPLLNSVSGLPAGSGCQESLADIAQGQT